MLLWGEEQEAWPEEGHAGPAWGCCRQVQARGWGHRSGIWLLGQAGDTGRPRSGMALSRPHGVGEGPLTSEQGAPGSGLLQDPSLQPSVPGTSAHQADGCGSCAGPPASLVFWELLRIPRGAQQGWLVSWPCAHPFSLLGLWLSAHKEVPQGSEVGRYIPLHPPHALLEGGGAPRSPVPYQGRCQQTRRGVEGQLGEVPGKHISQSTSCQDTEANHPSRENRPEQVQGDLSGWRPRNRTPASPSRGTRSKAAAALLAWQTWCVPGPGRCPGQPQGWWLWGGGGLVASSRAGNGPPTLGPTPGDTGERVDALGHRPLVRETPLPPVGSQSKAQGRPSVAASPEATPQRAPFPPLAAGFSWMAHTVHQACPCIWAISLGQGLLGDPGGECGRAPPGGHGWEATGWLPVPLPGVSRSLWPKHGTPQVMLEG